jgi:hypothetical protein
MGIDCSRVAIPQGVQHLLGIVNFLHSKLAAIRLKKIGSSGRTRTPPPLATKGFIANKGV